MQAAAYLAGDTGGGAGPTMHELLSQRHTVDPIGSAHVSAGSAGAGALAPRDAASRFSEQSCDNGHQPGKAAFQLGPKTAALLEQVDSRNVRNGWQ